MPKHTHLGIHGGIVKIPAKDSCGILWENPRLVSGLGLKLFSSHLFFFRV